MNENTNIIAEDYVIRLSNNGRYYLLNELSDLVDDGSRYFSAVGVNPDNTFDFDDAIYLHNYEENGQQMFRKIDEDTDLYKQLVIYATAINAMESIPGYAKKIDDLNLESSQ